MAPSTVRTHTKGIYGKLSVSSRRAEIRRSWACSSDAGAEQRLPTALSVFSPPMFGPALAARKKGMFAAISFAALLYVT